MFFFYSSLNIKNISKFFQIGFSFRNQCELGMGGACIGIWIYLHFGCLNQWFWTKPDSLQWEIQKTWASPGDSTRMMRFDSNLQNHLLKYTNCLFSPVLWPSMYVCTFPDVIQQYFSGECSSRPLLFLRVPQDRGEKEGPQCLKWAVSQRPWSFPSCRNLITKQPLAHQRTFSFFSVCTHKRKVCTLMCLT